MCRGPRRSFPIGGVIVPRPCAWARRAGPEGEGVSLGAEATDRIHAAMRPGEEPAQRLKAVTCAMCESFSGLRTT